MRAFRSCLLYFAFAVALVPAPARGQWTEPVRISEPGRYLYPLIEAQGETLHVVADYDAGDDYARYYRSTNAGDEWSPPFVIPDPEMTDACVLPALAVAGNEIYVSWLNIDYVGPRYQNIGFRRSINGGDSWFPPELVLAQDRRGVSNLTLGIADDFLYVIYTEYIDHQQYFHVAKSFDRGDTWSDPEAIFPIERSTGRGAETEAVGDTIHVVWSGLMTDSDPWRIYYFRSTDGGESWSENFSLRSTDTLGAAWPCMAANERGDLAACWMDYRYAPFGITGDIFCRLSFDGGESWGGEIQLTQVHESMESDVAWVGDNIYVAYEDWRFDPREIWFRRSSDNGQTWGEEERLTDDCIEDRDPSVSAADDRIYVVYSKIISNPDSSEYAGVYFKRYDETVGTSDRGENIPNTAGILSAYPNPFNASVVLSLVLRKGGETGIKVFDIRGRLVKTIFKGGNLEKGTHKFTWDATDAGGKVVSSGLYFAVATTPQGKIAKSLTLIR